MHASPPQTAPIHGRKIKKTLQMTVVRYECDVVSHVRVDQHVSLQLIEVRAANPVHVLLPELQASGLEIIERFDFIER